MQDRLFIIKFIIFNILIFFIQCNKDDNVFLFSVISAIYNTGKYLHESINSIINQTIGFEKYIQLILINDGSTDNTEEICLKYKDEYPNNIIYKYKNHGGTSSARNLGLKYRKGKYINFLDPDDIWSNDTFKLVSEFIVSHKNIGIIAGRIKFFEGRQDYHPLDYKFYKTRVIDLNKEYMCIQMSAASCFFKAKYFKETQFFEGLIHGEDRLFINNFLVKNPVYAVIKDAMYFYRNRIDGSSAIQTSKYSDIFYFTCPYYIDIHLLNTSSSLYNRTLPFIQYNVAYEVLARIRSNSYLYISFSKYIKYIQIMTELLKRIDDKYILEQRIANYQTIFYALSKKKSCDMRNYIIFDKGKLKYKDIIVFDTMKNRNFMSLIFIEIKHNLLQIEAKDNFWLKRDRYYFYCKIGNEIIFPEYKNFKPFDYNIIFGNIFKGRIVKFQIPLKDKYFYKNLTFHLSYMNNTFEIFPLFGYYVHIPPINNSYYISGDTILTYQNFKFKLIKNTRVIRKHLETNYCKQLIKNRKKEIIHIRKTAIKFNEKNNKKEIWLLNDRINKAGDNGEYFWRYLIKRNPYDIEFFFVIKKNCSDFIRLRELGQILVLGSEEYNQTFLRADKIISSCSDRWVVNPFGLDRKFLIDLFHFDFIFLQHGIIKDDLSKYLNRFTTNFSLFITSSKYEYNSILSEEYGYTEKNVVLTGLSRFDNIHIKQNLNYIKRIIIIPTWRMNIKGVINRINYENVYSDTFKNSDYFKFYNTLINSPKLLKIMEKYKYKGIFCLHPSLIEQWKDFTQNSLFKIKKYVDYQKLLIKSSLLITDYSSVFFDFSYMKKPVIYAHFDYEEYRKNNYHNGYFDYFSNGFGPICTNLEDCIDLIIDYIIRECKIKNKYLKRIKRFFRYFDSYNCDRIYKAIRKGSLDSIKERKINMKNIIIIIVFIFFLYKKTNLISKYI